MGVPLAACCWLLSLGVALFGTAAPASCEGLSLLSLALLPWLALAGLPHTAAPEGRRRWPGLLGLALPPLALAAWLDLGAGGTAGRLLPLAAGGLLLYGLYAEGAYRGARRAPRLYAGLWLALVLGLPALGCVLAAVGAGWPRAVRLASPITWVLEQASTSLGPGSSSGFLGGLPLAAVLLGALLLAAPSLGPRR